MHELVARRVGAGARDGSGEGSEEVPAGMACEAYEAVRSGKEVEVREMGVVLRCCN